MKSRLSAYGLGTGRKAETRRCPNSRPTSMGHCACPHLISGPSRGQWKTPAQAEPADDCSRLVLALLMRAATQEILQFSIAGVMERGDMNLRSSRYELQERQNNFLLTAERRSCSPRPLNRKSALKHALFSHHPTRHGRDREDIPSLDSLLPGVMRTPTARQSRLSIAGSANVQSQHQHDARNMPSPFPHRGQPVACC